MLAAPRLGQRAGLPFELVHAPLHDQVAALGLQGLHVARQLNHRSSVMNSRGRTSRHETRAETPRHLDASLPPAPSRPSPPSPVFPTARPTDRLASCQHVVPDLRELGVLRGQLEQQRLELGDFALRAGQLLGAEGRRDGVVAISQVRGRYAAARLVRAPERAATLGRRGAQCVAATLDRLIRRAAQRQRAVDERLQVGDLGLQRRTCCSVRCSRPGCR